MRENIFSLRLNSKFSPRDSFLSTLLRFVAFVGLHHGWIIFKANSRIRQLPFVFSSSNLFHDTVLCTHSRAFIEKWASFFCFPVGRSLGQPWEPRGSGTILVFLFSPRGRGVAKSWKQLRRTTRTHPWDMDVFEVWSALYIALHQLFFAPFYFISCQISILCCGCSYFPLGKGYFSSILCPLPKGF